MPQHRSEESIWDSLLIKMEHNFELHGGYKILSSPEENDIELHHRVTVISFLVIVEGILSEPFMNMRGFMQGDPNLMEKIKPME